MAVDPKFASLVERLSGDPTLVPGADGTLDMARLAARFTHPEKLPALARADLGPATIAALAARLLGYETGAYESVAAGLDATARDAARALFEDPDIRAATDRLPFGTGDRVLALGDSITDDSLSWANLLPHLLALAGRGDVEVVNVGISGNTTSEVIGRFDLIAATEPAWVILMIGTNDARRHGRVTRARIVSLDETRRNLALIAAFVTSQLGARLAVMTPPPIIDDLVARWEPFVDVQITWQGTEIADVAAAVRATGVVVADIHEDFGDPADERLLQPDGLHPTLAGQQFVLARLLSGLAELPAR